MAIVKTPASLHHLTEFKRSLTIPGQTVQEVFINLTATYPALKPYLLTAENRFCTFISIYVNGQDCRSLANEQTTVATEDIISIIPAIAGG